MNLALFSQIGFQELVIILVIVLLLFGRRFPEAMRSIGKGIIELKKGLHGVEEDINKPVEAESEKQSVADEKPDERVAEAPEESESSDAKAT
jgi:sec-independent protein translocase protein TatA